MNIRQLLQRVPAPLRQLRWLLPVGVIAAVLLTVFLVKAARPKANAANFFEVRRGDFLVSVVEGGTLESVREEVIRSEVEGTARIIYIVPEGTYVKKDDQLVALDSSASEDAVNQQMINVEKAQFGVVQAQQQLDIVKSTVDSETDAALLKVEFAQTALDKYTKGEAEQLRRNAQIEITNVVETLQIAEERLQWTEKLFAKGYETKSNLDKDRLTVMQTKLKLEQAQKELWMLQTFDEPKKLRELEAALQEAKEDLERVKLQGDRKIAQAKADLDTQKSTLELSKKKLERDQRQLLATKVKAPQDGLVVYPSGGDRRFSSESMIEEGAVVRFRQELIKLPDTSEMKLIVKIHESHINNVRAGQAAYVVLDAMPDQRFLGVVNRVAPLPDSMSRWGNPNLKVYATEILVRDKLPNVKPGVSARAEVIITNLQKVITVPIQAVTTRKGKQVVFLAGNSKPAPVSVGLYNTKFIEVTSGLTEGDRVLLSPPFDSEEKDLGGSIMASGEAPPQVTNPPARIPVRPLPENGRGFPDQTRSGPAGGPAPENVMGRTGASSDPQVASADDGMGRGERGSRGTAAMEDGAPGSRPRGGEGRGGPGGRFNQEEMLKQFDTNGDGQIDETERAAIRERFGRRRPGGGTNAVPEARRSLTPDESN